MNRIAKRLAIALAIVISLQGHAQILKYRSAETKLVMKDSTGEFVYSTEWKAVSSLITMDPDKKMVKVYSLTDEELDIISVIDAPHIDEKGSTWYRMSCVDKKGIRCATRFMIPKGADNSYFYIDYINMTIVYKIDRENNQ